MTSKRERYGDDLAVSRSTVEAHGRQIWAENDEPGGAVFQCGLHSVMRVPPAGVRIQKGYNMNNALSLKISGTRPEFKEVLRFRGQVVICWRIFRWPKVKS